MTEDELKIYLLNYLAKDFIVRSEVEGRFLVDGTGVVIDYLMYPKQNLIERGFVAKWFGIEVKSPDNEGAKKGVQVAWQAITYSQSEFEDIRPAFVLVFPPLAEFFGSQLEAYHVICLLQKANVGYIEINSAKKTWKKVRGERLLLLGQGYEQDTKRQHQATCWKLEVSYTSANTRLANMRRQAAQGRCKGQPVPLLPKALAVGL